MAYKSSPRPVFDGPARIPYASVTRHIWGDDAAGRVDDWIYVSSTEIHQLVFGLPPGGGFTHSESFRTVFAADELLTVLTGTMVIANPESGEVLTVAAGDSLFFRRDTWHHAFAWGAEELRVLEYFAPPPATGTSGNYARTRPYVDRPRYGRPELHGSLPMAGIPAPTLHAVRAGTGLMSLDPGDRRILTETRCATEHLTAGTHRVLPGAQGGRRQHRGATGLYCAAGRLNVLIDDPEAAPPVWHELHPGDGFYLPPGVPWRLFNMGGAEAVCHFGIAPGLAPGET